ncbi:hypothetical protein RHS04_06198 [Rhizoctonia solani]|uniref:BZIP domain-containing protein n=1 Tax=Rhizoctonia solani TaxID=456999 RepID=A0A8H7LHN8_9AGAM|nr:hypothetical protein RHS04_06198 [Rhizoctonia solani]
MASQSHDSDEEMSVTPPGSTRESKSLSRNARAQARLRARRKAYVESLEANVKRLQTIVDAIALNPNRTYATTSTGTASPHLLSPFGSSPETPSSDPSTVLQQPSEASLQQLQADNARLQRERDALQVQIDALISYISRGYSLPSGSGLGGDTRVADLALSPNFGSDAEIDSRASMTGSPLIQRDPYSQDDLDQILSLNDPNLVFMRYLNLQSTGPSPLQVPRPDISGDSSPATFESLSASTQGEPMTSFARGAHDNLTANLIFRGAEP